ncbi:MAG: ester cyclase [Chloroflexi bacterium]|nr:ester cyclase [Chloroflexota bacterium]
MTTQQHNKQIVWTYYQQLTGASPDVAALAREALHPEVVWHGPHPINTLTGADAVIDGFWRPLLHSVPDARRDTQIFFAGQSHGAAWVTGYGYFTGTFAADWLGIPATGQPIAIRFGEVCRMVDGKIAAIYTILDLLDVMRQAGYRVLPPSRGAELIAPEPRTGDGVLLDPQAEAETQRSYDLVYAMLFDGLNNFDQADKASMGMRRYWDAQMCWYGPCGIGAMHDLGGFEQAHQLPFLNAFPDRKATDQEALFAEGSYVVAAGFPGVIATHTGEYLGVAASGQRVAMRVMDWWRRDGDLLVENWVLIDMIDVIRQCGVDLLARLRDQLTSADA